MKKVLLTGGAGFIGSNLVRFLIEQKGLEVLVLDKLTYAGNRASLADLEGRAEFHFKRLDLSDADAGLSELFRAFRPDAVVHLAAESHVDRSIDRPHEFVQSNIVGTYHLLQASLGYWRSLQEAGSREQENSPDSQVSSLSPQENLSDSYTFPPTKFMDHSHPGLRDSRKRQPMPRVHPTVRPKPRPTIWFGHGITPMDSRS